MRTFPLLCPLSIALFALFTAMPSWAQSPSCYDEMEVPGRCLPWGHIDLRSALGNHLIVDLSKDGSVVAGGDDSLVEVFRWKLDTGLQILNLAGTQILGSERPVLSEDGSILVGRSTTTEDRVFRWDAENDTTTILPLGTAEGVTNVYPARPNGGALIPAFVPSVSGDGNTIAGWAHAFDGDEVHITNLWPFIWTQANGTTDQPQQDISGSLFNVTALDGFGFKIIGRLLNPAGLSQEGAGVWLPVLGGTALVPANQSRSTAVSYDGQVIAGARSDAGANGRAWRWTQATGVVDIVNRFYPRSISDDGRIITGWKTNLDLPWLWHETAGDVLLNDYFFVNFGLKGFIPSTGDSLPIVSGDGYVFSVLATKWVAKVAPLRAVGMGDSYSSGEGAPAAMPKYMNGTDTDENKCHRSLNAYAALVRPRTSGLTFRQMATNAAITGFDWQFIACSGATTDNVRTGGDATNGEPPQLDQNVVDADTDLVTISIGGNDAQFSRVLRTCVTEAFCVDMPAPFEDASGQTLDEYITDLIDSTVEDAVRNVYTQIKNEAPNATIIALGYPWLVSGPATGNDCPASKALLGPFSVGDGLTTSERNWMREKGRQLNERLARAASQIGIEFVPVAEAFEGRNVCDMPSWINGILDVTLSGASPESFHPNVDGHKAYAKEVNKFLEGRSIGYAHGFFESGMPRNRPPTF